MNKTIKRTVVALLCMTSAVMVSAGVNAASNNFNGNGYAIVRAEETTSEIALDLSKKHTYNAGSGFDAPAKTIMFHWASGSQSGSTWGGMNLKCGDNDLKDLITLTTYVGVEKTLSAWATEDCITRVIIYGDMMGVNLEKDGLKKEQVKYITLKKGLMPIKNADGWGNDGATAGAGDATKALTADVKLYVNLTTEYLEKAVTSLVLKNAPTKTTYETGDSFDPTGMKLTATYFDNTTDDVDVTAAMCAYDFRGTGTKQVTVAYHDASYTQEVTVTAPAKTVTSIAVKSGVTMTVEQYKKDVTLSDGAKIVVAYSDESSDEINLTADMISGYKNETVGNDNATVTYRGKTCEIAYTVTAYTGTCVLSGVKYGTELSNEGVGGFEFYRTDTEGLKAMWDTDKADSAIIGKKIGDLVKINGETVSSLVAAGKVARMWENGTYIGFHSDDDTYKTTFSNNPEIELLPGFSWVTSSADSWGVNGSANYTVIEETILTQPVFLAFKDGKACKVIDSVTLTGTPKTVYNKGDILDVSGLQLKANYKGLSEETIDVTTDMCTYDFSTGGEKTVTITFEGKTQTFTANVAEVWATGLELVSAPTKTSYDFGIENEIDLTGISVKVNYSDNTSTPVDASQLTISGFDSRTFGTQNVKAAYGNYSVTFDVTVENKSTDKYLFIDYHSSTPSFEDTQHHSLVVPFILNGVFEDLGVFWKMDQYDFVADYMLINDIPVSQLIKEGKITRLCVWANQLVIHMDTAALVPCTRHSNYAEGTSVVVETVTFLPGFQWYVPETLIDGLWGNDTYSGAIPVIGAVLKEKIVLTNADGYGWQRGLKTNEDGTIASDALTVNTLPEKVEYMLGEALNIKGMKVLVKYADGGEELIAVGYSDVEGYKKNVLGDQTLTYTYGGASVTFTVTVVEESSGGQTGGDEETKSGCGSAVGMGSILLATVAMLGSAAIVLKKKER